jgi:hypothetical protein
MAITATWHSRTGASAGTLGSSISSVVYGGSDDGAATAAADPITAGANSIRRYFICRFTETAGVDTTITSVVIDRSDSNGSGTNLDGQAGGGTTVDAQAGLAYAENSVTALTSITALGVTGGGTSITPTAPSGVINSGATASRDSQEFAVQVDTHADATAGVAFTLRCSFNITA